MNSESFSNAIQMSRSKPFIVPLKSIFLLRESPKYLGLMSIWKLQQLVTFLDYFTAKTSVARNHKIKLPKSKN